MAGNLPCVRAKFERDREGLFIVDTGKLGFVSFNAHAIVRFDLLKNRETETTESTSGSSSKDIRQGRIDWFELGGRRFEDVFPVGFDETKKWSFSELSTAGKIGLSGLVLPFKVVFDYPHKRIAFVKLDDKQPTSAPTTEKADHPSHAPSGTGDGGRDEDAH